MPFYLIIRWLQVFAMVGSFLMALTIYKRLLEGRHMKILFYYLFVASAMSIMTLVRQYYDSPIHLKLYYYTGWSHFLFLAVFILLIQKPIINNSKIITAVFMWFVMLILILILYSYKYWMIFSVASDSGLLILCCYYYYRLFSDGSPINIFTDPSFWVVTGIFVCKCFSLPMVAFYFFFKNFDIDTITLNNIFSIGVVGYIIMHLFFIKALLCLIRRSTI